MIHSLKKYNLEKPGAYKATQKQNENTYKSLTPPILLLHPVVAFVVMTKLFLQGAT